MTKAEECALKVFPSTEKEWKSEFGTFHFDDTNIEHREGFIVGYEQAEKDLALTWEDARLIVDIGNSILDECYKKGIEPHLIYQTERQFSEEIIKRFREAKK